MDINYDEIYNSCEYVVEAKQNGEIRPLFNKVSKICFGYINEFTGLTDKKCKKCKLNYHTKKIQ